MLSMSSIRIVVIFFMLFVFKKLMNKVCYFFRFCLCYVNCMFANVSKSIIWNFGKGVSAMSEKWLSLVTM